MSEFHFCNPLPRRGFTSIEAVEFVRRQFPDVQHWTCWRPKYDCEAHALAKIISTDFPTNGRVGKWSWRRLPTAYPPLSYWDDSTPSQTEGSEWVGALEINGPAGERFILFSCLTSLGEIGSFYLASTLDTNLLKRLKQDVYGHFQSKDTILIHVVGGEQMALSRQDDERIFLQEALRADIELQVFSFFPNRDTFTRLRLRHRRGFLFVGAPGTGKTMMLRHLIRQCHVRFKTSFTMIHLKSDMDEDRVAAGFQCAARRAPCVLILEDLDSLTRECKVTRSSLLQQLDGLVTKEGILVIGTTNNAEEIDPALIHRPSRFDRVWHFPLPDDELRRSYLQSVFENFDSKTVDLLVAETEDWSFAYLNELRTTAALLAMNQKTPAITASVTEEALTLLSRQFQAGKRNFVAQPLRQVGFATTKRDLLNS